MLLSYAFCLGWLGVAVVRGQVSPQQLASSFGLQNHVVFDVPMTPLDNTTASSYILNSTNWNIRRFQANPQDVSFVPDPFSTTSPQTQNPSASPSNASATVLQVNYPKDSFSHGTGGVQFDNFYNTTPISDFTTMIVSYELAFDTGFDFVKGGKLPGLRGGPDNVGCSGGLQPNGTDCFSSRIMWRTDGAGEAYMYMLTPDAVCTEPNIICNSDSFGDSINRGSFVFTPGQWDRITMLVQLNTPGMTDGILLVYFNDALVINENSFEYRLTDAISSIQGMYFSTFFGGNDTSWETPESQNTYFRNIQLWGGQSQADVVIPGSGSNPSGTGSLAPGATQTARAKGKTSDATSLARSPLSALAVSLFLGGLLSLL